MPKRTPLPSELAGTAFSVDKARAAGISKSRLRASDLRMPIRGVRAPVAANDPLLARLSAYRAHMANDEYFSHLTAAQLYGIPLPRPLESAVTVHVSVQAPSHPPQVKGVAGHRLFVPIRPRMHRGFRTVSPGRAWTQLAATLSVDDLIVAGDFLVRRKGPLCTMAELEAAVKSMGVGRGVRAARLALAGIRPCTDSPMETRLRLMIIAAGLPEPVIHFTVHDWKGDFIATPDLAYIAERIAIEYEGSEHQSNPAIYADDIERRELLEAAGWLVIRVVKGHLRNPHLLTERIRSALRDQADLPPLRTL